LLGEDSAPLHPARICVSRKCGRWIGFVNVDAPIIGLTIVLGLEVEGLFWGMEKNGITWAE
jgi:hypothetical protein